MAAYEKINFVNEPDKTTPLSAANLNHMEDGIANAQNAADTAQESVNEVDSRVDLVEQRLDNLIPQGTPTEGNAELIDIRAGGNGTNYPTAGDAVRGQYTEVKSALANNEDADELNAMASFKSVKDVFDGELSVHQKFYGIFKRGSAVNGIISPSTVRAYAYLPLTDRYDEIYFDDTAYKLNVNIFINDEFYVQSGWVTSSPYLFAAANCDYVIACLKSVYDPEVTVDVNTATKTTYMQKTITKTKELSVAFVSNSGSDTNSGDAEHPLATVNKALERGADRIYIASGDYRQTIDLSKSKTGKIELLKNGETGKVYFRPTSLTLASSETKVEGYTKVYSAPISATLADGNVWIFHRNTPDARTNIENSERMPQERGYKYRLWNTTPIKKCLSNNLSDALNEIDNSNDYLWYADNGTLYFSRQISVEASKPLVYCDGTKLFVNNSRNNTVIMTGINCEYMPINIDYTTNSVITDCSVVGAYNNGAFSYDYALNATFIRCEACCAFNTRTMGDGFNGHGKTGGGVTDFKTTARLFDCWSHDNNDDGFSDHNCCESEIYGGLFEYNGKGGVTPSYGAHCKCVGVYSRHNYNGFHYTGEASSAEQGYYGQLECVDCVAEENTRGTSQANAGFLVSSNGNRMILVNCKSINNTYGYYATSGTLMTLIDCGNIGGTLPITGAGTRDIKNTTVVTPS